MLLLALKAVALHSAEERSQAPPTTSRARAGVQLVVSHKLQSAPYI